jgi:hypothetical protein
MLQYFKSHFCLINVDEVKNKIKTFSSHPTEKLKEFETNLIHLFIMKLDHYIIFGSNSKGIDVTLMRHYFSLEKKIGVCFFLIANI